MLAKLCLTLPVRVLDGGKDDQPLCIHLINKICFLLGDVWIYVNEC